MAEQGAAPVEPNLQNLMSQNAARSQQGGGEEYALFGFVAMNFGNSGLNSFTVNSALNMFGDLGAISPARDANWGLASNSIIGDIIAKLMEGKDVSAEEMAGVAADMGGAFAGVSAEPQQDLVGQGVLPPTGVADDYNYQKVAGDEGKSR